MPAATAHPGRCCSVKKLEGPAIPTEMSTGCWTEREPGLTLPQLQEGCRRQLSREDIQQAQDGALELLKESRGLLAYRARAHHRNQACVSGIRDEVTHATLRAVGGHSSQATAASVTVTGNTGSKD